MNNRPEKYETMGLKHYYYTYRDMIGVEISSMIHKKEEKKLVYILHACLPIMKIDRQQPQQDYSAEVEGIEKQLRKYIGQTLLKEHPEIENKYILVYDQANKGQSYTLSIYPTLDLYLAYNNTDKTKYKPFKQLSEEIKPMLNTLIDKWIEIIQQYEFQLLPTNNRRDKIRKANSKKNKPITN